MAENEPSVLPTPSPEQRRVAVGQFERAQQVTAKGDFDYGVQLLLTCCKLDPGNLTYRKYLRQVEKNKYKNNMSGSRMALLTTSTVKAKLKAAKRGRDFVRVLELGEEVLTKNPWDTGAQLDMSEAADQLGLLDVAVWFVEQARQKDPKDLTVNRALARLYEKRGNFKQAIVLWEMIHEAAPTDVEAQRKSKDLAACDTIARGNYGQAVDADGKPRSNSDLTSTKEYIAHTPPPPTRNPADRLSRETEPLRAKLKADPANATVHLHLAHVYRKADQFDQARIVLVEALSATGNHFDVVIAYADLEIETFRRNLAITEEKLKKQATEELHQLRRELHKEINSRELDIYRKKADRYPTEKALRFELGVRLLRAGQLDEAIRELQPLRSDSRYQWKVLMYLGYCFKNRNNWRLAQRNFEDALKAMPETEADTRKEVLLQLAVGAAGAGELAAAVDVGHELANLDFSYGDIGRLLDEWQTKLQET